MNRYEFEKQSATAPEALAAAANWIRGHRPLPPGVHGPVAPSRADKLLRYLSPAGQAVSDLRGDVKNISKEVDRILPGTSRRIKGHLADLRERALEMAEQHGPGVLEKAEDLAGQGFSAVKRRLGKEPPAPAPAPPPSPWYHDPAAAIGTALGVGGLSAAAGLAASNMMRNRAPSPPVGADPYMEKQQHDMSRTTALSKIATALDLLADELDAMPTAPAEEKTAETADVFGDFYEFYKQQVGEEPPATLVEKLAQDADEETVTALQKLVKRAGLERPTPLGEPSDGGGYREPPSTRGDATKMAWEQFEETLLNYDGA